MSRKRFLNIFVVLSFNPGGENLAEVVPTIKAFESAKIGSILDLAIEADLDSPALSPAEAHNAAKNMLNSLRECIDIAAHQHDAFIAVKITAFFPPELLLRWTSTLDEFVKSFPKESLIDRSEFNLLPSIKLIPSEIQNEIFSKADFNGDGKVSLKNLLGVFSIHSGYCKYLINNLPEHVTEEDLEASTLILSELDKLCNYASEKRVKLMMDAEQTYFQTAIDDIVLGLAKRFNNPINAKIGDLQKRMPTPLIYNTYQMYLKTGFKRMVADYNQALELGYSMGLKLVRGAYMQSERERAHKLSILDPINENISATHKSYNDAIAFLIDKMAQSPSNPESVLNLSFVVASHNQESQSLTCKLMEKNRIPKTNGSIGFGQLMGMQDLATYKLAANGFRVYKVMIV